MSTIKLKLSINYIIYTYLYTLVSNTLKDLDTVRKIISNILEIMLQYVRLQIFSKKYFLIYRVGKLTF